MRRDLRRGTVQDSKWRCSRLDSYSLVILERHTNPNCADLHALGIQPRRDRVGCRRTCLRAGGSITRRADLSALTTPSILLAACGRLGRNARGDGARTGGRAILQVGRGVVVLRQAGEG